jgi:hypothetical protein
MYWVDWLVAQRHMLAMWQGRLEALLARHWPEATRVLKLSRVTCRSFKQGLFCSFASGEGRP